MGGRGISNLLFDDNILIEWKKKERKKGQNVGIVEMWDGLTNYLYTYIVQPWL
jgi:hypothetical protein